MAKSFTYNNKDDKNIKRNFILGDVRYTVIILVFMQMVFSIIGYQLDPSNEFLSLILFMILFYLYLNLFDQRLKRRKSYDKNETHTIEDSK